MSHEIWILTLVCGLALLASLATLAVILYRGGRSKEAADTIGAIRSVAQEVGAMRVQNSNEHHATGKKTDWIKAELGRLVERFGFLARKDAPEPPTLPVKRLDKP